MSTPPVSPLITRGNLSNFRHDRASHRYPRHGNNFLENQILKISSLTRLIHRSGCKVPVFFDFGHERPLWCLLPKSSKGCFYILPFHRQNFVTLQSGGTLSEKTFDDVILYLTMRVFAFENPEVIAEMQKAKMQNQAQVQVPTRSMMQRYVPAFRMGDLNYLLRPRQNFRRRGRRL